MASQTRSGRFQVGDKVQLAVTGRRGRVVSVAADSPFYYVQWDDQPDRWGNVKGDQLEPISRPEPVRRSVNTEQSDVVVDDSVNHDYDKALRRFGWTVTPYGCWEWNGGRLRSRGGYGQLRIGDKVLRAHRVAYEAWIGPLGDNFACHKCDNPPCVNPDHLFAGTHLDNMRDAVAKGRAVQQVMVGEDCPAAVLTEEAVLNILRRLRNGEGQAALALEYGVTRQSIWKIDKGRTWKHLSRML